MLTGGLYLCASEFVRHPAGTVLTGKLQRVRVVPDSTPAFELDTTIGSSPERFAELRAGRSFTVRYLGTGILIEPVVP